MCNSCCGCGQAWMGTNSVDAEFDRVQEEEKNAIRECFG